jgi:S1-C subfamily serine protease
LVSAAGYVLTNRHVADAPGQLAIRLPDGKEDLPVKVVARSDRHDIALLKFDPPAGSALNVLPIATTPVGRGTQVAAFGFPNAKLRGFKVKFAEGTINGLPEESNNSMYMLSVLINPGNSGGPLCDMRGNVVGLVAAKTRGGLFSDEDSYGLAIPAEDVTAFLDEHLPADAPRPPPHTGDLKPWIEIDPIVSRGVLLILVKAKA